MKKAQIDPFQLSARLGYYILTLMIIGILFTFFAVLIRGSQTAYYTDSFGTEIISMEENVFSILSLTDDITLQQYQKVIDYDEVERLTKDEAGIREFNERLGIFSDSQRHAIEIEVFLSNNEIPSFTFTSRNYPNDADIVKVFPILATRKSTPNTKVVGYILLRFANI